MARKISKDNSGLSGLILAGGKSSRLGKDKAFLEIHDEPQINYLMHQFDTLQIQAFVSTNKENKKNFKNFPLILDDESVQGPLAGIFSALKKEFIAWLIIAVDMPFLSADVLKYLISNRNPGKVASSFTLDGETPEPMICVWEPSCKKKLKEFIKNGGSSPIEFLKKNDVHLVRIPDTSWVKNVNDEEELTKIKEKLKSADL